MKKRTSGKYRAFGDKPSEPHIIETHYPQSSSSFNTLGEFDFSDGKLQDTIGVLPPKKQTEIIPENWEVPNR